MPKCLGCRIRDGACGSEQLSRDELVLMGAAFAGRYGMPLVEALCSEHLELTVAFMQSLEKVDEQRVAAAAATAAVRRPTVGQA